MATGKTLLGVLAGLLLGASLFCARADDAQQDSFKADYLPKFPAFITWPDGTFVSATAPVNICVLGFDPFAGKLDQNAGAVKDGERPVAVRHLTELAPESSCQLLFLGAGNDAAAVTAALDALKGKPVVTVTDTGLKDHGVISFVIEAGHVRFDIDDVMAAQDNLVISSKLLALAHAVRQRGAP